MPLFFLIFIVFQGIQALDSKDLMFLLAKQLSPSGVNSLGRIVLPKVLRDSLISILLGVVKSWGLHEDEVYVLRGVLKHMLMDEE